MHGSEVPSAWVQRWSHLVPAGGSVLDVACGHGRHLHWFAGLGHTVTGVDRDPAALAAEGPATRVVQADVENGPWPFEGQRFDGVIVTNYLWRALLPTIIDCLAEGGVLIYETFASGNASVGKPSRPDFLLQPGELLNVCQPALRIIAYEDGFLTEPERFVQRVVAVREAAQVHGGLPTRYALAATPDSGGIAAG